jgi:hypothetical protein
MANLVQVRYGSTWGARRGGSGGTEGSVEIDGITEYITQAYVWHGSYFDSLLFKTNRGRTVGGLNTAETDPSGEINAQVTLPCVCRAFMPRSFAGVQLLAIVAMISGTHWDTTGLASRMHAAAG